LPVKYGGLGLVNHYGIAPAAFYASVVQAAPVLRRQLAQAFPGGDIEKIFGDTPTGQIVRSIIVDLRHRFGDDDELLPLASTVLGQFGDGRAIARQEGQRLVAIKIQAHFTRLIHHAALDEIRKQDSSIGAAHVNVFSNPQASYLINSIPTGSPNMSLKSGIFACLLRLRLSVADSGAPTHCAGCNRALKWGNADECDMAYAHLLACPRMLGGQTIHRHDSIKNTIARFAREARMQVTIEPPRLSADSRIRPDLLLFDAGDNSCTMVDVSVTVPLADSHLEAAAKHIGATAEAVAKAKRVKYAKLAEDQQATFLPFVMESYGFLHHEAEKIIQLIVDHYDEHVAGPSGGMANAKLFEWSLRNNITMDLLRGTARRLLAASGYSRRGVPQAL
jgi:hypothetical protein